MSSHGRQKMEGGEREKKEKTVQIFKKFCCQKKKKKKKLFQRGSKKKMIKKSFELYIYILHHICLLSSQFTGAKRSHLKQWRSGAGDEFPFSPHPPQRLPLPLP